MKQESLISMHNCNILQSEMLLQLATEGDVDCHSSILGAVGLQLATEGDVDCHR